MFVLPALLLPLVFSLAIVRLYQVPRRLWQGELQLAGKHRIVLSIATVAAYLALLVYTLALGAALVQAIVVAEGRMAAYLALLAYVGVYPLVYFLAAWVFYYGLIPSLKSGRLR